MTNNDWAIPTDDNADARRFLVLRAGNDQKQNGAYFAAIDDQMRNGGLEAMVYEFMNWNPADAGMSFDDLRSAPWTPARAEQASHSASAPKAALLQIIDDGFFTDRDGIDVPLSDTKPTRVRRADLAQVVQGKAQHGGARKAARKAIEQVLGDGAWHDLKHKFEGSNQRERFVEFPLLKTLKEKLTTKGRKATARAKAPEVLKLKEQGLKPGQIAKVAEIGVASVYRILADAKAGA